MTKFYFSKFSLTNQSSYSVCIVRQMPITLAVREPFYDVSTGMPRIGIVRHTPYIREASHQYECFHAPGKEI